MSYKVIVLLPALICILVFPINVQAIEQAIAQEIAQVNTNQEIKESRKTWNFIAYLDDMEIGYQTFEVVNRGDVTEINIEAVFDVRFMFISFYSYKHKNTEKWSKACLSQLNSETDDDGNKLFVEVTTDNSQTYVESTNRKFRSNQCVRSFAYWDIDLLKTNALLNSQTGELIEITYKDHGLENISVNNQRVQSRKIQLLGKDSDGKPIDISLWYNLKNEWLALESKLEDGQSLRYKLKQVSI